MTRHPPITCASTTIVATTEVVQEPFPSPRASHHSNHINHSAHVLASQRLFEDDDGIEEVTEDGHECMSASALIAHGYRLSIERESVDMHISSTACQTSSDRPAADTWSTPAVSEDKDGKTKHTLEESSIVRHMLCNIAPTIIDHTAQSVDILEDNAQHSVLQHFRRVPHTIVLDSFRPKSYPHIVITPPPDTWANSAYNNRVNQQSIASLSIPPFYLTTCRTATYEEWKAIVYPTPQVQNGSCSLFGAFNYPRFCRNIQRAMAENSSARTRAPSLATLRLLRRYVSIAASQQASTFCRMYLCEFIDGIRKSRVDPKTMIPQRVFSPSAFQAYVNHTSDERNHPMTRAAVYVTHRLLLRLEAIKASSIATEWRSRYDDPHFLASVDRRFRWQWNDPADPIFYHLGPRPVNVTVIHSTFPCSAPHIVIHGAEPNDPWTTWGNSTGVQDCAYGNALVVVSAKGKGVPLTYINISGDKPHEHLSELDICDYDEFGGSEDGSSLCSDSSGLCTPTELQRVGSGFFSEAVEEDLVTRHYESYSAYISAALQDNLVLNTSEDDSHCSHSSSHTSSGKFYFADDDDEDDGPPEYDEWFISIANRAGLIR